MHIKRLALKNFGPFREVAVHFHPVGVSVISGPNASGKSQLLGAAVAAIVGKSAVMVNPEGCGPSSITLVLEDGKGEEVALLNVSLGASTQEVEGARREFTHTSTPMTAVLHASLQGTRPPRLLLTEDVTVRRLSRLELEAFEARAPAELVKGAFWHSIKSSGWLESNVHSAGVAVLIDVVREFIARTDADPIPLLVDGVFGQLDSHASQFCAELLREVGRRSQVIVVLPSFAEHAFGQEAIRLPRLDSPFTALAHYTRPAKFRFAESRKRQTNRMKFVLGERFAVPENRICELKEVKGNNPVGSITQVADQYVVAFLNAGIDQTGSIYWGITDEARTVVGVPLTDTQCDEIRRLVVDKVGSIMPPLPLTSLSIDFHPISFSGSVPLYVVEVRVPSIQGTCLYATGSDHVYVKTESGKRKLTTMQIQQELLRRMRGSRS